MTRDELMSIQMKLMWCRGLIFDVTKRAPHDGASLDLLDSIYRNLSVTVMEMRDLSAHLFPEEESND